MEESAIKDFSISFNNNDERWAEWVVAQLEEAGCSTVIQARDFRPDGDFVMEMQKAATEARWTIVVLSDNYLNTEYAQREWGSVVAFDPQGKERALIPIRIAKCRPKGLLGDRICVDLVGLSEDEARQTLLDSLIERATPVLTRKFPGSEEAKAAGSAQRPTPKQRNFPGVSSTALNVWREKLEFLQTQAPSVTSSDQMFALHKQIAEAERRIEEYSTVGVSHNSAYISAAPELQPPPKQIVVSFVLKEPSGEAIGGTIAALKQLGFEQCTSGTATVSARLPLARFRQLFGVEARFTGASPPDFGTHGTQAGFTTGDDLLVPPELEEFVSTACITPPMDRLSQ